MLSEILCLMMKCRMLEEVPSKLENRKHLVHFRKYTTQRLAAREKSAGYSINFFWERKKKKSPLYSKTVHMFVPLCSLSWFSSNDGQFILIYSYSLTCSSSLLVQGIMGCCQDNRSEFEPKAVTGHIPYHHHHWTWKDK